ncbi:MAG: hypothetical protein P4L10_08340 [Acidobacteriaceae bacterium]|nr:hypothetical protein [Acidobacteriaceae bacterium]
MKQLNEYKNNQAQADKGFGMRFVMRVAAMLAAIAVTGAARAQAPNVVPIPFASAIAGLAIGSSSTLCSNDTPTYNAVVHTGDGCLPTQASFLTPYTSVVDSLGNVYIGDYGHYELRVIYNGGAALAAAIAAANTNSSLVPQVGHIYALAGGRTGAISKSGSPSGYYCNTGTSSPLGLDSSGNGCPGTNAYIKPRTPALDKDGNVFFTSASGGLVRVFVVNPSTAITTLLLANGSLGTNLVPTVGSVYSIVGNSGGYNGDGGKAKAGTMYSVRDIAVDANENLYISDGNTSGGSTNNNIRRVDGTTAIITTFAGSPGCAQGSTGCTPGTVGGADGDGGLAINATFNSPYALFLDVNANVYVADATNARIRAIYQGTGGLVNVSNPQAGYVYTVAGGGSLTATTANNGVLATQLAFGAVSVGGIDQAGNIYVYDSTNRLIWKVNGTTGIATVLVGMTGTAPVAGAYCSGSTGPKSVDTGGDGCPGTQLTISPSGQVSFDNQGNFYETESGNAVVRKFSFNTQFPATATGSTATQPLAFLAVTAANFTAESFGMQGAATTEFSAPGGDTCTLNTAIPVAKTCVFYAQFAPTTAGLREGAINFTGSAASLYLSGIGQAAMASMDPGTQTTIGTGLKPNGVAADLIGNLYISDATSNTVKKVAAAGGTPATLITGLSNPAEVAVDGKGNIYVADTGNNRIAITTAAGGAATTFATGFTAPTGVAVDAVGNVYVADTGANRVVEIFAIGGQKTLSLSGLSAPGNLALDGAGDLYIVDQGNKQIVELGANFSQITVPLGTNAPIPSAVAVDTAGNLYITDATNLQVVGYLAGSSSGNMLLNGLTAPIGIAADVNGSLYIADQGAGGVIAINRTLANIAFPVTNLGSVSNASLSFTNSGNLPFTFNGTQFANATGNTAVFSLASASTNGCVLGTPVAAGNKCQLTANFSPVVKGNYTATISPLTSAANNGSLSGSLSGEAVLLIVSTTTTAITQPTTSSIYYGQIVTIAATTSFASNGGTPVGTASFTVDGGTPTVSTFNTSGVNAISLPNLTVGTHTVSVSVVFSGYVYASSGSAISFTVLPATTTTRLTLTPTVTSGVPGTLLTATVTPISGTNMTGPVIFFSGTPVIVTGSLNNGTTAAVLSSASSVASLYVGQNIVGTCVNSSNAVVINMAGYVSAIAGNTVTLSNTASTRTAGGTVMCSLPANETLYAGLMGTGQVSGGVATYSYGHQLPFSDAAGCAATPIANCFPANNFTSIYAGAQNFSGSTSAVVRPAGDFTLSVDSSTVSVPQGGNAQLPADGSGIILTPYFGYTGTPILSCSGLPQYAYCRFQPIGTVISGTAGVGYSVVVYTDSTLSAQNRNTPREMPPLTWALLSPLGFAGLLLARRKRLLGRAALVALAMVISLASVMALTGCTNPLATPPAVLTPTGSQTVTVTFADSNTPQVSHSISFNFTVTSQ